MTTATIPSLAKIEAAFVEAETIMRRNTGARSWRAINDDDQARIGRLLLDLDVDGLPADLAKRAEEFRRWDGRMGGYE